MAQSEENTRLKKETEILITVPLAPVDAASGKNAPADSDKAMYKNGRSDQYARGMAGLLAAKTGCRVFPASRIQRRDRNGSAERGYGEFIAQLAPKAVIKNRRKPRSLLRGFRRLFFLEFAYKSYTIYV